MTTRPIYSIADLRAGRIPGLAKPKRVRVARAAQPYTPAPDGGIEWPMATRSPNGGWGHHQAEGARKIAQRDKTKEQLSLRLPVRPKLPAVVTITRVSGSAKGLDPHDNLPFALKAVVDGIADYLGLKSDRDPRVEWRYANARGPDGYLGVRVQIEGAP